MTPLQRKAAFRSTVTLKQMTMTEAARHLGVSYNHLALVLAGQREASTRLKRRLGSFLGVTIGELFPRPGTAGTPHTRPPQQPPPSATRAPGTRAPEPSATLANSPAPIAPAPVTRAKSPAHP